MKIITWNVNGIRACEVKGMYGYLSDSDADMICIQETKAQPDQIRPGLDGYGLYISSAQKKGYSGTAVYSRIKPQSFDISGIGDDEGRTVCLEYDGFYLIDNYVPNAQDGLARIDFRLEWEAKRRDYMMRLDEKKPVIMCGDLNVAHNEIDLKNPKSNEGNAGFSKQERDAFSQLLDSGFTDAYRYLYPDRIEYSWWSYRMKARERNVGWRIDYFIVSDRLKDKIKDTVIRNDIFGSDHCPVELYIDL